MQRFFFDIEIIREVFACVKKNSIFAGLQSLELCEG
jgi:hypothetical protein